MKRSTLRKKRESMVEDFRASGLTQSDYAERHGISLSTLRYWIRKTDGRSFADDDTPGDPAFIPLQVAHGDHQTGFIEILYPDGLTIRIPMR